MSDEIDDRKSEQPYRPCGPLPPEIRRFFLWARKWLKTSKPTEWVSSMSVLAAIITGTLVLNSNVFDAKRAEAEAKKAEAEAKMAVVKLETIRLEDKKEKLEAGNAQLESEKVALEKRKRSLDEELSKLKTEQNETVAALKTATDERDRIAKNVEDYFIARDTGKPYLIKVERRKSGFMNMKTTVTHHTKDFHKITKDDLVNREIK